MSVLNNRFFKAKVFSILLILAGMTSCLGVNADIVLNPDNSGTLSLEYRFSLFLDSLGRLDGNENLPPIPVGRRDIERTIERIPGIKLLSFASGEDEKDRIITAKFHFSNLEALLNFMDAGGEKAVFSPESGKITLVLSQGGGVNPELDALMGQIAGGYLVNISMIFPSGGNLTITDGEGAPIPAPGKTVSQGKKVSCSLPLETILSAEKGLSLEFRW